MRELKKKQAEAEEIKKLQELRRKQMEQKMKLEARNKIIIQQKIENHKRERLNLLRRYFNSWSLILVERRKQSGMAQACRNELNWLKFLFRRDEIISFVKETGM